MNAVQEQSEEAAAGKSYRATVLACYTANFIGALVVNLTPILFIPLKMLYGLSYTQFGILLAVNYVTQVLADIVFSWPADRYGSRPYLLGVVTDRAAGFPLLKELQQAGGLSSEQFGLRSGLLFGAFFPAGTFFLLLWFRKYGNYRKTGDQ